MQPDDHAAFDLAHAEQLPARFFDRSAEVVARELLGAVLVTRIGGTLTAGRIVETEAYLGADDPGSHASTRGITNRNRVMYGPAGRAYVYFTYGNHHMLNLVTCPEGTAGAVLIRAVEPLAGVEAMRSRRRGRPDAELTNGPGKVAEAFGITLEHNDAELRDEIAVFRGRGRQPRIETSGRIGLASGHELELRFFDAESAYVSRGRLGPKPPRTRRQS